MRCRTLVYLAAAWAGMAPAVGGQSFFAVKSTVVVPGVVHRQMLSHQGPWTVNVVAVDLRRPELSIRAVHANGSLRGRETVSSMAARANSDSARVIAAINGDFFNLKTGEDDNNQVIDGEVWKGLPASDSPQDSAHHAHAQFAVGESGRPLMDTFTVDAKILRIDGAPIPLAGVNCRAGSNTVTLYTPRFASITPADTAARTVEIRLRPTGVRGDTSSYEVVGRPMTGGASPLVDGSVLSLPIIDTSGNVPQPGEAIRIVLAVRRAMTRVRTLVGGWPRLIVHGRSVADSVDRLEGTVPSFSAVRHPRTGVGFSRDSTILYFVTVDGRQESSSGMSLPEFARLMLKVGVFEGLNLDGGGSTAMVVGGQLVNHPSDPGGERTVGNALLVVRSRHE